MRTLAKLACLLSLVSTPSLFGQGNPVNPSYPWVLSDPLTSINTSVWVWQNGSVSATSYGLIGTGANGGSLIYGSSLGNNAVVRTTLTLNASGGTYVTYLRASTNALSGPSATGTFYSVELQNPTFSGGGCTATLALYKTIAGSVSSIASAAVGCNNDMTILSTLNSGVFGIYVNNAFALWAYDTSITTGNPGIGARGITGYNSISLGQIGPQPTSPPSPVNPLSIGSSSFPNRVDLQWQGATDGPTGIGIAYYQIWRNGSTLVGDIYSPEFTDETVSPSTTYTYTILALDFCQNPSTGVTVTVVTPPASSIDPRRIGTRPTATYWGASPEQLDVLSGNLTFALPLLSAQGRGGWGVGLSLSYNSQNWREDSGGTWNLGEDVGYGYGWKLMAGSLTPYWAGAFGLDHYVFTDSSGAQYRLTVNTGGIWTSTESIYVSYNANTNRLYFRDGSFWVMGSYSAGTEQDAGTMYPTVMEDTNGNQILVTYEAGAGVSWINSSARIATIADTRAVNTGSGYTTYTFSYGSNYHLSSIANSIGTAEGYSFSYGSPTLYSPFASTSYGATSVLSTLTTAGLGTSENFTYDTAGEMTKAVLPYGGYLAYVYSNVSYGSRTQREVTTRYLSPDGTLGSQQTYSVSHDCLTCTGTIHQWTTIADLSGIDEKYWGFSLSGSSIGLVTEYLGGQYTGPAVWKVENDITWTQDANGNFYLGSVTTTADPGQSYAAQKKTTQTLDINGNVTQVNNYNFANLTTPARTYNYSYLNTSAYTSLNIFNRLTSASVTNGTTTTPLASISYDQTSLSSPTGALEWDTTYGSVTARGNPTTTTTPAGTSTAAYNVYGNVTSATVNGITSTVATSTTTNYSAPDSISVGGLTNSMTYNSFLGLTNQTGPNGAAISLGYNSYAQTTSSTSAFGAVTYTTYNLTSSPPTVVSEVNNRYTTNTFDGLGRVILTQGNYQYTSLFSQAETVYGPSGGSPLGQMTQQAIPHAPGTGAVYTVYTYDGLGRTLTITAGSTDTTGTTSYSYQGNTVTVTDPAGKWKTYAMDAFGNLTQTTEPNPGGGSNFVTTYTYDLLNHLAVVSMTRSTGTQTRTFTYSGNYLTSATNPENGTVSYTYNSYNKVATRTDAKNQETVYTYDSLARLTEVQYYPTPGTEDTCQRQTFYYDGNAPSYSTYPQNAAGRLSAVQYMGGYNASASPTCDTTFTELYTYGVPGAPTGKQLSASRVFSITYVGNQAYAVTFSAAFTYDNEGRMTGEQYPSMKDEWSNTYTAPDLGNGFDGLGRPYTLTDLIASQTLIQSATYGPADELLGITGGSYTGNWGSETHTYNSLKQLTQLTSTGFNFQYNFPTTGNNGKIGSQTDLVSGEQVTYTYDALNRLATAATQSTFSTPWGQGFSYDGFGNLTNVNVTLGTAPAFSATYDANNHAGGEDGNGNPSHVSVYGASTAVTYDVENRLASVAAVPVYYSYAPGNQRVWRGTGSVVTHTSLGSGSCNTSQWSTDEITFWGVNGQKLMTYQLTENPNNGSGACWFSATQTGTNYYFGGKMIKNAGGWVYADALGSIGKFYPYGLERPSATTNGREKFTGYFRDAETGLDYANQRYYNPGVGRFVTPDRESSSGKAVDPGSWNRYAYVGGDPVSRLDPSGTDWIYGYQGWCSTLDPTAWCFNYDLSVCDDTAFTACTGGDAGPGAIAGGSNDPTSSPSNAQNPNGDNTCPDGDNDPSCTDIQPSSVSPNLTIGPARCPPGQVHTSSGGCAGVIRPGCLAGETWIPVLGCLKNYKKPKYQCFYEPEPIAPVSRPVDNNSIGGPMPAFTPGPYIKSAPITGREISTSKPTDPLGGSALIVPLIVDYFSGFINCLSSR